MRKFLWLVALGLSLAACGVVEDEPEIVQVSKVTLNSKSLTLTTGKQATLVATIVPQNATEQSLRWDSTEPTVARVNTQGIVTALSVGDAYISVRVGGKMEGCWVEVTNGVAPANWDMLVAQQ